MAKFILAQSVPIEPERVVQLRRMLSGSDGATLKEIVIGRGAQAELQALEGSEIAAQEAVFFRAMMDLLKELETGKDETDEPAAYETVRLMTQPQPPTNHGEESKDTT